MLASRLHTRATLKLARAVVPPHHHHPILSQLPTPAETSPGRGRFVTQAAKMATPYKLHILPQNTGLWKVNQTEEAAKKATELLQRDLEEHHVFFNNSGFHNHIVHHILALYGTGAGAKFLQKGFDDNASYQRRAMAPHDGVPEALRDWEQAKTYLGKEKHYADFLAFFQREMERTSWRDVLAEYVFKGDERADDMLVRLFAGFVHPLIQLMYGVEWEQPALVATGLAQACVHSDDLRGFLLGAERLANENGDKVTTEMGSIASLYDAVRADEAIAGSIRMSDGNKLTQGVIARAGPQITAIAARVKVRPGELHERTVEMFNTAIFSAASAARHPTKHVKFDFFLIHHVNVAPIFLALNAQPWLSTAAKTRILEFKIRVDLAQYAARGVPPMSLDRITSYKPKKQQSAAETPLDIVSRLRGLEEDGHAIKLGRAAGLCQAVSEELVPSTHVGLPLNERETWMKVLHMIVDSVEGPGEHWVRTTGLEEAWENVEDAPKL